MKKYNKQDNSEYFGITGSVFPDANADSGHADSEHADSERADSERADSERADSERADSERADSGHADSEHADSEADGIRKRNKTEKGHRNMGLRNRLLFFGVLALILLLISVFADRLTPYDPALQDLSNAKAPPSAAHLMGTDRYGRDLFSRVISGSRASIFSTLLLVAITTSVGTAAGIFCGWNGKRIDTFLMRVSDIFLAFPGLVFAMAVAGVLGGGLQNAIIALTAISWPKYARIARSQTLSQKELPYIRAAKLACCNTPVILFRHLLPNIIGPILVTSMLDIGTMMMELSGLSFLGLGARPPMAEWGSMMSDARGLMTTSPWIAFAPGFAIFVSVMIFNLLGDTIRDYADPKTRSL